jgi:hypothetical protein
VRIIESSLRQLIRETLLTEVRWTPQTLIDSGYKVTVGRRRNMVFVSCDMGPEVPTAVRGYLYVHTDANRDKVSDGKCLNAWEIELANVSGGSGMGPLLYDVAMELSGQNGLMPDRDEVSAEARSVWEFYLRNRPDIEVMQLDSMHSRWTPDIPGDFLTPGFEDDNCFQKAAWEHSGDAWMDSALSKAYRVKGGGTPTIDKLRRLGLIEFK